MDRVYVVVMNRWGDRFKHTYVHAVCSNRLTAHIQGALERTHRGGAYEYVIEERQVLNSPMYRNASAGDIERAEHSAEMAMIHESSINHSLNIDEVPYLVDSPETSLEDATAFILPKHYVLEGFDDIVEPSPSSVRLKRSKGTKVKDMKKGKSKHYKKNSSAGWTPRKKAKRLKKDRI